jgi:small subunit ribosomal protein S20
VANKMSSKKRVRQNEKRRIRNRAARSTLRGSVKAVRKAVETNEIESIESMVSAAQSKLGKGAKNNLIKKNTLARTQSRLMKAVSKAKTG